MFHIPTHPNETQIRTCTCLDDDVRCKKSVPLLLCITLPSFSSIVIIVYVLSMFSEISFNFGTLCVTIIKELATMLYYYQGFRSSSFTTINRHLTFENYPNELPSYLQVC